MEVVPTELARAATRIEVQDQVGMEKSERSAASGMVPSPTSSSEDRGHWLQTRGGCSKLSDSAGLSLLFLLCTRLGSQSSKHSKEPAKHQHTIPLRAECPEPLASMQHGPTSEGLPPRCKGRPSRGCTKFPVSVGIDVAFPLQNPGNISRDCPLFSPRP
jgi:hypothetical protein